MHHRTRGGADGKARSAGGLEEGAGVEGDASGADDAEAPPPGRGIVQIESAVATYSRPSAPTVGCPTNTSGGGSGTGGGRLAPTHFTPEEIQLYPNPSTDHFTLNTPDYEAATEVSIVNTQGQIIDKRNIFGTTNEIETHELPNGLYYIRMAQGERSTVLKLVVMK